MASSSQRAVKREMAKLFSIMEFNDRTILSRVTSLVTFAADNKLIVVDNSAPFTSNIEGIWYGCRGKYHSN